MFILPADHQLVGSAWSIIKLRVSVNIWTTSAIKYFPFNQPDVLNDLETEAQKLTI